MRRHSKAWRGSAWTTAALLGALLLGGCSDPRPAAPATLPPPPATEAPPADDGATAGGDGSAIQLSALSPEDIRQADLAGELGCSFSTPGAAPLLVATGNVASKAPAEGLVKVLDFVERVSAPNGFDGIVEGATFSGRGKTVRVTLTGPAKAGGESPPRPATLTYDRGDGASRTFVGRWVCGP